jgi:hypothetical protein
MRRSIATLLLALPILANASGNCALVVGGSVGPSFSDPAAAAFWHEVNKGISSRLFDRMILEKYRIVRFTVEAADAPNIKDVVVNAMVRQRCDRVLQVLTLVGEDIRGKYFGFTISMLHAEPKQEPDQSGMNSTLKSEYSKTYRYVRTPESFDSFKVGAFADSAFADTKASGVFSPLETQ